MKNMKFTKEDKETEKMTTKGNCRGSEKSHNRIIARVSKIHFVLLEACARRSRGKKPTVWQGDEER